MSRSPRFDAHETARLQELDGVLLAPFGVRWAAFAIDMIPIIAIDSAWELFEAFHHRVGNANVNVKVNPFHGITPIVVLVLYFGILTYLGRGQSPGKRLMKLRVVSTVHERLTLWHCLERALGYGASALEGGFGFIQYFTHPNRRTVHDRIAETIVVSEREQAKKR
jgi:uncharacterized RDD family membrane protein YckC